MNTFRQTILVVEDETLVRFAIADALEDAGHRVLEAGNVLEAVGQLGLREDIALVLTDVDMPGGLNGVDLARMVAECAPHIGIIVSSARRLPDLPELPAAARYLPKPGTPPRCWPWWMKSWPKAAVATMRAGSSTSALDHWRA